MKRTKEIFAETREAEERGFLPTENKADELKRRVIEVKKRLPKYVTGSFVIVFPEYNTYKGKSKLTNVLQLRVADLEITEKLEILAEKLNK